MNKEERNKILIELYQKWIQPRLDSPNFPPLSEEDILKTRAKKEYKERYEKEREEYKDYSDKEFDKYFKKKYGLPPESLISQKGWFLISDAKEKDVSNIHYSFGFEETNDSYWVEIALNSVASVEQFLSMNDKEIKEFFKLCKNKPPRMVLTLTKKTKTNFAGSTNHELLFEKEMCKLTEQDIKMVRVKANEINNLKDPLIKPFIGLCVVNYVSKEELADNFSKMEDVFEFIKSLIPRQQRYKNTLREEHQLEKRLEEVKAEIKHKTKIAEFMKNLGKFDDQEKLEKSIMSLEQELEEITSALQEKKEMLITLERDMGGRKNESTKAMVTDSSTA